MEFYKEMEIQTEKKNQTEMILGMKTVIKSNKSLCRRAYQ